jgi:hypothetical protein
VALRPFAIICENKAVVVLRCRHFLKLLLPRTTSQAMLTLLLQPHQLAEERSLLEVLQVEERFNLEVPLLLLLPPVSHPDFLSVRRR